MGTPEIASILAVFGTVFVAILAFRLIGFRQRGLSSGDPREPVGSEVELEVRISELQDKIVDLQELILERDERFENLMRMTRYELDKRFRNLDRNQVLRERELERHQQREADQSRWRARPERRFALPR